MYLGHEEQRPTGAQDRSAQPREPIASPPRPENKRLFIGIVIGVGLCAATVAAIPAVLTLPQRSTSTVQRPVETAKPDRSVKVDVPAATLQNAATQMSTDATQSSGSSNSTVSAET